ncbi:MAG TPA: hypothetical protein VHE33_20295 [Acidobacteriaceae bacterium]|nr:hypothetical protein [Acidobacteriaceae bacterium]
MVSLRQVALFAITVSFLSGCSSTSTSSSPAPQPAATTQAAAAPQIVTGKTAFWEMYKTAHAWASDAQPMRLTMKELPGYKNEAGKAGMWEATFGSGSLRSYRTFTYAIAAAPPNIYKGVDAGMALPWGGPTRDAMPIDTSMFTIDSDAAYTAAAAEAAPVLKTKPDLKVTDFEVGATSKFPTPVWYILWGSKKAGFAAVVDGSSGKVMKGK